MRDRAESVSALMKVLSHPNRLLILCLLAEGERSVGELAERVGMREAAVSQQLAMLRQLKLAKTRREGQSVFYALARDDLSALMAFLYETYCPAPNPTSEDN